MLSLMLGNEMDVELVKMRLKFVGKIRCLFVPIDSCANRTY